jgi:PPOX class probable F420-dependent enzyme
MSTVAELGAETYLSLVSYKRDGTPVATPLWVAADGDALVLWTVAKSWKVQRIRRNPQVTVTPCTVRGKLTGETVAGRAEVMPATESARVRRLIKRKYGLTGRLTVWLSVLRRGPNGTLGIRVSI